MTPCKDGKHYYRVTEREIALVCNCGLKKRKQYK